METIFVLLPLLFLSISVLFLKHGYISIRRSNLWKKMSLTSIPYYREIMEFIGFYLLLPPKSHLLFLTPEKIGVCIADDTLANQAAVYLSLIAKKPENQSIHLSWFLNTEQANLGGEQGAACFARLPLEISLLQGTKPYPVIFLLLPVVSEEEKELHLQTVKTQYQKIYQKDLPLCVFSNETALLQTLRKGI